MANGTIKHELARADRMRERDAQSQKATRNAISNLREASRELPAYRDNMDSSEVTVNTKIGTFAAKGVPPWALGLTLVALAIVAVLRFWPR